MYSNWYFASGQNVNEELMARTVRKPVASTAPDILVTTQMGHVTRAVSLATKDVSARKVSRKTKK